MGDHRRAVYGEDLVQRNRDSEKTKRFTISAAVPMRCGDAVQYGGGELAVNGSRPAMNIK